jgi:outer membrane protein assembly factor BamB
MTSSAERRNALRLIAGALAAGGLAACSSGGPFGMFGGNKNKKKLPGQRISVLALERELRPDIQSLDTQLVLPRPEDIDAWPQAGGLSHHAMGHMMISANPKLIWRADIGYASGKRNRNLCAPIVADGRVYTVNAKSVVEAFDANTGKKRWSTKTAPRKEDDGAFLGGGVAYEDGKIFVTGGFAEIVALDAANGKVLWREAVEAPIHSAPTVNGGRVFAITLENQVVAHATSTGKKLWTYSGASAPTILLGGAAPAVDGGVVIAPFTNGELAALRVDSGAALWNETVVAVRRTEAAASLPDIAARPVIDRGRVYAIGHSGVLVAVDLRTGQRVWDTPIPGIYEPWIAGDFLFAISLDSELVCVDVRSGRILWVTQLQRFKNEEKKTGRIVWAGPALASDRLIVVGSHAEALSVSPYSGDVLSHLKLAAPATLAPVFAKSTMYLLNDKGDLTAYR